MRNKLLTLLVILGLGLSTFTVQAKNIYPLLQTHLKKNGTPDRRFKENKKLTKAGKPDMRYKSNNPNAGKKKKK